MTHSPWTRRLTGDHPPQLYDNPVAMIGNTPLVRLSRVAADLPPEVELWAKLEYLNPGGSVKDRPARHIILNALARGLLGDGQTLIDATSGNTGIAYAMLGAALGVPVTLVMPADVSHQRKSIIGIYGAQIIESPADEGTDGAIRMVRDMVAADSAGEYYYADQYSNLSNPTAHEETTAPEIHRQTNGQVTHFVTGIGTSGTIMGTGRGLKAIDPSIQIIGAQPATARHALIGLKHLPTSIPPNIFARDELDGLLDIDSAAGVDMALALTRHEGILCGNSSGANVAAALEVARGLKQGVVVTIICDHFDRYVEPRTP